MKMDDRCPDCGKPFSEHVMVTDRSVRVDIYEVIARIVIGSRIAGEDGDAGINEPSVLADVYRETLAARNQDQHDRLFNAAVMVMEYVEQCLNAQMTPMDDQVAGHA